MLEERQAAKPDLAGRPASRARARPSRRRPESNSGEGSRCAERPGHPDRGGACSALANGSSVEVFCPRAPGAAPSEVQRTWAAPCTAPRVNYLARKAAVVDSSPRSRLQEVVPLARAPIRAAVASVAWEASAA